MSVCQFALLLLSLLFECTRKFAYLRLEGLPFSVDLNTVSGKHGGGDPQLHLDVAKETQRTDDEN